MTRPASSTTGPRLIGLCGYAGAGKDTAARALTARGWQRFAFADPLRVGLLALDPIVAARPTWLPWRYEPLRLAAIVERMGWDQAKHMPEVRRLLQHYGTEAGRNVHGADCWVALARRDVTAALDAKARVVITDVRFPNEARMIRELGGLIVRIDRPSHRLAQAHASERLDFEHDALIVNHLRPADLQAALLAIAGEPLHSPDKHQATASRDLAWTLRRPK